MRYNKHQPLINRTSCGRPDMKSRLDYIPGSGYGLIKVFLSVVKFFRFSSTSATRQVRQRWFSVGIFLR